VRIEIIGNIASGKTTLSQILSENLHSICENFHKNPFWESFYNDPHAYSFETEITFTLQHYHQIKKEIEQRTNFVCDFSLTLDRAYADITLSERRRTVYKQVLAEVESEVGFPDLLIHLECAEQELLERIRQRGRGTEKTITTEYLKKLTESISHNVQLIGGRVRILTVDSGALDFAHRTDDKNTVKKKVLSAF
jgi:deoxyadenosine/deoxycytidine kinase